MMAMNHPQRALLAALEPVFVAVQAAGGQPLVVGGAVRDVLLGLHPADIDIEVYGISPQQLVDALEPLGNLHVVGRSFGVLKLRLADRREVDVALPRRESRAAARGFLAAYDPSLTPREALARRDFTFNALALTLSGDLLDYFGGVADLRNRVIRHTSNAFADDPLRVLRAVQFAARFAMRIAPATAALSRQLRDQASSLARERVGGEWWKWARLGKHPSAGLHVLEQTGWLALYPELEMLTRQPGASSAAWQPTLRLCDLVAARAHDDQLPAQQRGILLLAGLCQAPGVAAGAEATSAFLARIGAPRAVAEPVWRLAHELATHADVDPSPRSVRWLAARLAPATIADAVRLLAARQAVAPGSSPAAAETLAAQAQRQGLLTSAPRPILQGRHLIDMGMRPGPAVGEVLQRAYTAQLDGAFETLEDALAWARKQV